MIRGDAVSDDELKNEIRSAYLLLLETQGLASRPSQRKMIAEIVNSLAAPDRPGNGGPPVCVVEAGTGTGKTLAYLLAVIPVALRHELKVVISTATVALQEQIMFKDIPDVQDGAGLEFSYEMAKGRSRYLCRSRLDALLQGGGGRQELMNLLEVAPAGASPAGAGPASASLCGAMRSSLHDGSWGGDRDSWPEPVADAAWRSLTANRHQCTGGGCSHYHDCCFFQARQALSDADCIVTNHDLVLSDLAIGGGVVLPDPGKCIYIFDEAHHLSAKSNAHFSASMGINASKEQLARCGRLMAQLAREGLAPPEQHERVQLSVDALQGKLDGMRETLTPLLRELVFRDRPGRRNDNLRHTFAMGVAPEDLRKAAAAAGGDFKQLQGELELVKEAIERRGMDGPADGQTQDDGHLQAAVGIFLEGVEACTKLCLSYEHPDPPDDAPSARWLNIRGSGSAIEEISLESSPVLAADNLRERLWETCAGAVLTSATLSALGKFDLLKMKAGLPDHARYARIESPFDFPKAASFHVPRMRCDPRDPEKHTQYIAEAIPSMLTTKSAALVLFSSRRQMLDVLERLPDRWTELILCQDHHPKTRLLERHRLRVDDGKGSIIFGLASFAEGIDLPGKYCTEVMIAKIPFPVPDEPVEATLSSWFERNGSNSFMELTVPEAALRLVQASGRLLRSETDRGRITLFDERIATKRYGERILDSLPPYRREIFGTCPIDPSTGSSPDSSQGRAKRHPDRTE